MPEAEKPWLTSIGHSSHSIATFVSLLQAHGVRQVIDVRSVPYSQFAPQFDQPALREAVASRGGAYHFLGDALGGRPGDDAMYVDGQVDYELLAASSGFRRGITQLERQATEGEGRAALVCSEADPTTCHRALLIGRVWQDLGHDIEHILAHDQCLTQPALEGILAQRLRTTQTSLFESEPAWRRDLYRRAAARVAARR